jgi:energy-coupling factor transport system permease protein
LFAAVGATVIGTTVSQGFFYTLEPRTELLRVLPGLSLSVEGVWYGIVVSLRLLAVLAAGTLVVFTTHPADLILALTKLGLPHWFAFMLTLALRFLPETIEQAKRILVAQQLRGAGGRGVRSAARQFRLLVVPLVTALLRSAPQIAMAAEVRSYSARRVPARELRFSRWDWFVLLGLAMLTVAGCFAACCTVGACLAWALAPAIEKATRYAAP